jgi:hypothetical protein
VVKGRKEDNMKLRAGGEGTKRATMRVAEVVFGSQLHDGRYSLIALYPRLRRRCAKGIICFW